MQWRKLQRHYAECVRCVQYGSIGRDTFGRAYPIMYIRPIVRRALQDGSRKQIRLHNRDLRVLPADSWHQPDSIEQKSFNMRKERNRTSSERTMTTEQQYPQESCLQNDTENVSIHMLNDDCLRHIFLFLPIIDRVHIERGE